MKIGILTHPLRFNYGGILQNFALQHVLKSLGHEVYTIDWNDDKSFVYMVLSYVKRVFSRYVLGKKHIPTNFYINLTRKQFLDINENNQKFIDKNINKTEYISSISNLSRVNRMHFDAIVVGSDQVWLEQFVPTMYLDFLNQDILRIAYAASFGKSEWTYNKKNTDIAKLLVKKFKAISVREESAVELCERYLNVSATWVLDPTLLLTAKQYNQVLDASNDFTPKTPYLFTYILDDSPTKRKISNQVKEKKCLSVYEMSTRESSETGRQKVPSVYSWLYGIKNASFVVTDSFHGMVFSIIYNRPFLVIGNEERGMARFSSLLNMLKLQNRMILVNNVDIDQIIEDLKDINYEEVNALLENAKINSNDFINKFLRK